MAKRIPDGYHTITPYLRVRSGRDAIAFYKKAFGAEEVYVLPGPDGSVMHGELKIGDSRLMLGEECKEWGLLSPQSLGGNGSGLHLYVEDVDASFKRAADAGCTVQMPPTDMFWGDRYCKLTDPFGHEWAIGTHMEDLAPDEIARRGAEAMKNYPPPPSKKA
jgi:uncharacterized glyoxalase superfamily protein PhnB